jgi:hypothetical protein
MEATDLPPIDVPRLIDWPLLASLQQRCMRARDSAELGFVIANETWHLLPYGQAAVFQVDRLGQLALKTVSGLAALQEETPFTLWLGRLCRLASADFSGSDPRRLEASMLTTGGTADIKEGWTEWWQKHAVFVPLTALDGRRIGVVMLVRDMAWEDADLRLLAVLAETWSHCTNALTGHRAPLSEYWRRLRTHPRRRQILALVAVIVFFPVRLSALAPAEIIPLQAEAIAAPMDGVIRTFHVPPNAAVKQGQALFSLDDTTLRNRRDVAQKALAVARADALATQQKAFDSLQSKSELAALLGRAREKEAELAWLDETLARIDVMAPRDGVLVYADANDWLGKPVITGERIAQLAQPSDLGVMMWLAVGDAINLEPGATMRVYLQVSPLSPLSAELVQTSYQATLSPDGIASYRIRGKLAAGSDARIGLRGVAKVYGDWRPLLYWIMRRPLGSARQWMGL